MFLIQKVEETTMHYSDARRAVGEFIIKEWKNLHEYTITDIAERTYTSKPTVTRFAKAMGYDGWREFMKDYVEEVHYEKSHESGVDANFPFQEGDSPEKIAENIMRLEMESIRETADLLDFNLVNLAVDRLEKARHIVIFAMSPNIYPAHLFKRNLLALGYVVTVADTFGEPGFYTSSMTKEDCAILISYSGNNPNKEPIKRLEQLKESQVPMIGITSGGTNYMRQNMDCVLTISTKERLYTKIANYGTEVSIEHILNVLYSVLFARNYRRNRNYKIANSRIIEQERKTNIHTLKDPGENPENR